MKPFLFTNDQKKMAMLKINLRVTWAEERISHDRLTVSSFREFRAGWSNHRCPAGVRK